MPALPGAAAPPAARVGGSAGDAADGRAMEVDVAAAADGVVEDSPVVVAPDRVAAQAAAFLRSQQQNIVGAVRLSFGGT